MKKQDLCNYFICILALTLLANCERTYNLDSSDDEKYEHGVGYEDPSDYRWDSTKVTEIILKGNSITADSNGIKVEGSIVTITSSGTYNVSGTLTNGQIVVNTGDKEIVRLILSGVNITSSPSAPIFVKSAEKVLIVLKENSVNLLTDSQSYIFDDISNEEPNSAIFSKSYLSIFGEGNLTVNAKYNDGIAGKDGLVIKSGNICVNSVDDGIRGKDYIIIKGGNITVNSGGDGLKSDNESDLKGSISIGAAELNITSGGDAIQAENVIEIADGTINLISGGGSTRTIPAGTSAKGIKASASVRLKGGTININSADDAIHSDDSLIIYGDNFNISTADDAIHGEKYVEINGGNIKITKSYEGIESENITINGGEIRLISTDDGLNAAGGNTASVPGGVPGPGGMIPAGNFYLNINGGYTVVDALGDGMDINGSVVMTGGDLIINGPTANNNGPLDYDGTFKKTGGMLIAAGSSGMAQAPGSTSTQYSILLNFKTVIPAGTIFHIQTGDGNEVITFKPVRKYQSVAFSSTRLQSGGKYDIYYGGNSTGTVVDGLYSDGIYTPGTKYTSFTISGIITKLN